jgi:hypothetical protein
MQTEGGVLCLMLNSADDCHYHAILVPMIIDLPACGRLNENCQTVLQLTKLTRQTIGGLR